MRVFTRTVKVLGVAPHEADALLDMAKEAIATGNAERKMSDTETLAIEVSDRYDTRHGRPADVERPARTKER